MLFIKTNNWTYKNGFRYKNSDPVRTAFPEKARRGFPVPHESIFPESVNAGIQVKPESRTDHAVPVVGTGIGEGAFRGYARPAVRMVTGRPEPPSSGRVTVSGQAAALDIGACEDGESRRGSAGSGIGGVFDRDIQVPVCFRAAQQE